MYRKMCLKADFGIYKVGGALGAPDCGHNGSIPLLSFSSCSHSIHKKLFKFHFPWSQLLSMETGGNGEIQLRVQRLVEVGH